MHSLLFLDKYFLRNRAIWPRFVFDWYFLSRNPETKIKEPGTSSSFVFLHLLHNISDFLNKKFNMQDIGPAPNNFLQDLLKLCSTGIYNILKFKRNQWWDNENRTRHVFKYKHTKWSRWCITASLNYKNTMINRITMETVACLRNKCHLKHTSCISDFRCKTKYTNKNFYRTPGLAYLAVLPVLVIFCPLGPTVWRISKSLTSFGR
jgi:hypothetical protein